MTTQIITAVDVLRMAGVELSRIAIDAHRSGHWHLVVKDDGSDANYIESTDAYYRNQEWTSVLTVGTGSMRCNCDACVAGEDPDEWAGDEVAHLEESIDAKLSELTSVGQRR